MQSRIPIIVFLLLFFIAGNAQNPAATIPEFNFEKQDRSVFTKKDLPPGFFSFFVFFDTECDHCQHAIEYADIGQQGKGIAFPGEIWQQTEKNEEHFIAIRYKKSIYYPVRSKEISFPYAIFKRWKAFAV
jgi:hypothetical protein